MQNAPDTQAGAAKTCTKCRLSKPLHDFCRNRNAKDGLSYVCRECTAAKSREHYLTVQKARRKAIHAADPEAAKARQRERKKTEAWKTWYETNKAAEIEKKRLRRMNAPPEKQKAHRERDTAQMRKWREANRDHLRQWMRRWAKENADKIRESSARRRYLKRMTLWSDLGKIAAVYAEAKRLEDITGIPHDVDHIYPLRGKKVCGLHVHDNLRAIPSTVNGAKLNKLPGFLAHELWDPNGLDVFHEDVEVTCV